MARVHIDQDGAYCPRCGGRSFRKRLGGMTKCMACRKPLRHAGLFGRARGRHARKLSQHQPTVAVADAGDSAIFYDGGPLIPVEHRDPTAWIADPIERAAARVWATITRRPHAALRACRSCGCTDARACPGGCWWVEADLCSTCQDTGDRAPLDVRDPYTGTVGYF